MNPYADLFTAPADVDHSALSSGPAPSRTRARGNPYADLYSGESDAAPAIETEDPGVWDSYVKPVLDSTPVRAATGLLSGFSDIAGGIAEEAKAALSGVQSRVKLSPEGIRQYAEDVGASSAPINPFTIDVARRGYEVPGVEQIAKEGIAQGIDTAAGAVGIDTDLSRADLSRAGGVQGPRGVAAAIAEGVGEFALGLGTDPISGAYLKANRSMQIAQDALARAEDIARTAPGLAQGAARRADDLLKAAQAEEWAAKQVDLGTGLAALPAIGGQALEQGQAAVEEYQRNGLTPAAAEAATQAALGLAGVGMVGMDARDVRRSMAERQRAEMAPDAHVRQFRTAPDELSLSPQEASGIESLRGLPEAPSTGPDIPAIEVGDLWAQERPDPRKAPTAGPVLGVDDLDLPSAEALVLEDQARAEEDARRAETAHYLLDPEPAPPEPGLPDVWQGDSPLPDQTLLPTEDAARMQWAAESDLLSRVMQERQRRDADRERVQEVRARALAEDIAAGRLGPEVQPAPAIEGDLESLIPDVGLHNLPTLPPGFGAMGADPGRARVPTPQLPPGFGGMGAEGRFPEALPEAPARQPRPAPARQEPPADVRGLDVPMDEAGVRVLPGEESLSPDEREAIDVATGEALRQAKALREQNVALHSRMRDRILAAAGVLESDSEPMKRKKLQSGAETVLYEEQSRGLVDPNVERLVDLALRDVTRETLGVKAREKKRLSDAAALVGTPLEGVDLSVKEIEKALRDDKGNRTEMKIREMVRENLAKTGEEPPEYEDEVPFMARRPVRQEGPTLFDQPEVREEQKPEQGPLFREEAPAQPEQRVVATVPEEAKISKPVAGIGGSRLVGYDWRSMRGERWSEREGGMVKATVSDWDRSDTSTGTGRNIVHVYYVQHPDGRITAEGIRSASNLLGRSEQALRYLAGTERDIRAAAARQDADLVLGWEQRALPSAAEARRDYARRNYSTLRDPDQNAKIAKAAVLVEKDGKYVAVPAERAGIMERYGWTRSAEAEAPTASRSAADALPGTVRSNIEATLGWLRTRADELREIRSQEGVGTYEAEALDRHRAGIERSQELIRKFREIAPRQGVDPEAVIRELGGEPDPATFQPSKRVRELEAERAAEPPPATTIERTKAGDQRTLVSALDTSRPIRPADAFHDSPLFNPEREAEARRLVKSQGRLFDGPAEEPATAPATELTPAPKPPTIADFGEKIGGARKDVARPLGPRGQAKEADDRPVWARPYHAFQDANEVIRAQLAGRGPESVPWRLAVGDRVVRRQTFATKAEAEAAIPLHAVSEKHAVYPSREEPGTYVIVRKLGEKKRPTVKGGFASHEDAMRYMATHPEEILGFKFDFPEKPWLDSIERTGKDHRGGRDVTPQSFQDAFGFRGGEFGLWNMGSDGQAALNHAYDGLHDLAEALGIPAKAISLNGELAIAFGARGHGGKDAALAHYEPGKVVINLTKIRGAGSLAHEWFHALEHYVGRQDAEGLPGAGKATYPSRDGWVRSGKVRPELRAAFDRVIDTMTRLEVTAPLEAGSERAVADRISTHLERAIGELRSRMLSEDNARWNKRWKKPTAEQTGQFDEIAGRILKGDPGPEKFIAGTSRFGGRSSHEAVEQLNDIYKQVMGRSFSTADENSEGKRLNWQIRSFMEARKRVGGAESGETRTKKLPTDYYKAARELDQKRFTDYWSEPHEMAARAFEAYVQDKIEGGDRLSQYLVHGTRHPLAYPRAEERARISAAFEDLARTIKTKETDRGVALFKLREGAEDVDELGYFSQLTRVATDPKAPKAASGYDWLRYIQDPKRAVKADELKWTGLDEYLKKRAGQRVTRDEIAEFLRQNNVQVQEIGLGRQPGSRREQILGEHEELRAEERAILERFEEARRSDPEWPRDVSPAFASEDPERLPARYRADAERMQEVVDAIQENDRRSWDEYARASPRDTKFDQYQAPGGENYREVLLTLPNVASAPREPFEEFVRRSAGDYADTVLADPVARGNWMRRYSGEAPSGYGPGPRREGDFYSQHWNDPNVIAHLRLNDRVDADGKRVLFVEEVQSDWAQKGRREGFAKEPSAEERSATESEIARLLARQEELDGEIRRAAREVRDLPERQALDWDAESASDTYRALKKQHGQLVLEQQQNRRRLEQLRNPAREGVPTAPFVGKTEAWTELALKRVLRMAAEGGYDRVAWTHGDLQVERYEQALRSAVDRIEWEKTQDGIHLKGIKDGKVVVDTTERETALSDAIGKTMGDQIIAAPDQRGVLAGSDLTISDTGMAGYYDRILPQVMGKLGKKFGARVGETGFDISHTKAANWRESRNGSLVTDLPEGARLSLRYDESDPANPGWYAGILDTDGREVDGWALDVETLPDAKAEALRLARQSSPVLLQAHSIDITPEMRRSVMEGQPLFQKRAKEKAASARVRAAEARERVPVGRVDISSHDEAHDAVARSLAQALGADAAEAVRRGAASLAAQVARRTKAAEQGFAGFTVDGAAHGFNLDGQVRLNILAELERAQARVGQKRTAQGASAERELARGIVNVLVHEIAHGSVKGHGPEHAAEMLQVMRSLAGKPMQKLRASIEEALRGRIAGLDGALREARVAWGEADAADTGRRAGGSDRRADGGRAASTGDRPGAGAPGGADGAGGWAGLEDAVPGGKRGQAGGMGPGPERGRGGAEVASRIPKTETPAFRKWFGASKVVDADGKPKLMLHGTGTPGFTVFDVERQDANALYGPGFYFTEAPEVAGGAVKAHQRTAAFPTEQEARKWAGKHGELYYSESQGVWLGTRPRTEVVAGGYAGKGVSDMGPDDGLRALDAIEHSPEYQQILHGRNVGGGQRFHSVSAGERERVESLAKSVRQDLEDGSNTGRLEGLIRELGAQPYNLPVRHILAEEGFAHESGGVMGAYLKIERPFDADAEYSGAEAHRILTLAGGDVPHISRFKDSVKGAQIIEAIRGVPWKMGSEPLRTKKFRIQGTLKAAGYDGITHMGGAITGSDPHRVFIAFDPTQIKSAIGNRGTFDAENPDVRFAKRPTAAKRRAAELEQFRQQAQRLRDETATTRDPGAAILDAMERVKPLAGGGTGQAPSVGVPELWEATRSQFRDRAEFDRSLLQLQQEGRIGTTRGDTGLSPEQFEASTVDPARPDSRIFAVYKRGEPSFKLREGPPIPRTDLKRNPDGSLAFDDPPRVEGKVEDFYRAAREAGIKDIDLKRDHPRTWDSLLPDVRRALAEPNAEAKLLKKATDGKLTDTDVLALDALRDGYRQQFERLRDERAKAADPGAVNAQIIDSAFRTAAVEYARVAKSDVQAGTALGRALAARRAVMQGFLKGKRLASAPDAFLDKVFRELPDVTPEQAAELAKVATSNRPELLADALHAYVHPAGPRQIAWWLELWKASILSGPGTQVANISGNAVEVPMRVAETLTSAAVDAITSRLTGAERTRYAGEAGMELRGAMKGAKAGLPQLVADLKDIVHARPERVDLNSRFEYQVGHISGKKGRIIRTPFRLLQAADRFFKSLGNGAEMGKLAWREAERELGQAAGRDAIRARAAEIAEEASRPDAGPKWQQLIEDVNRGETSRVFQDDPAGIVHLLLRARAQYPVLHFVLPFVQTPANIASLTLERLGGGFLAARRTMKALEQAKAAGAPDAAISRLRGQAMDELARPTFGLAMMTALAGAAAQGALTGSGPADQEEKAALRETGWQPYSVRIDVGGGRSVFIPYNRLEPASSLVGIAADIVESKDSRRASDLFAKGMASIAQNITSKSYLEGLSNAVEVIHDPARSMRGFVAGLAGSLVPNIVASASRAVDPAVRDVAPDTAGLSGMPDAAWRKIVSRIPGASFSLPQRLGPTGERIERPGSAIERFLLPSQVSATKAGKEVEAEIARVGGKAAPGAPSRDMVVGQGRKVRLTDEEFLLLGEGMQRAADRVRKLMDAPAYRALPDTEDEGGANSKEAKIRRIWDQAREESRARVRRLVLRRLAA